MPGKAKASRPGLGFEWIYAPVGLGLGLTNWTVKPNNFNLSFNSFGDEEGNTAYYRNISIEYTFFDTTLYYIPPIRPFNTPIGIYGFLGLGTKTEKYTVSLNHYNFFDTEAEWNGGKSASLFEHSYGVGLRFFLSKYLSLISEYRWIPGVGHCVENCGTTYSDSSGHTYVTIRSDSTTEASEYSILKSIGIVVNVPL